MKSAIIAAIIFALVIIGGFAAWREWGRPTTPSAQPVPVTTTPGVEVQYLNSGLKFSFGMPDGILAQEGGDNGATIVKLHDASGTPFLEVVATPAKSDPSTFDAAAVAKIASSTKVSNATAVTVAPGVTGIAFDSTDPLWGGPSKEIWFAYKGYRYQISAAKANAELLDFVWKSWQWRK
jgi:hypothetical protein